MVTRPVKSATEQFRFDAPYFATPRVPRNRHIPPERAIMAGYNSDLPAARGRFQDV